MELNNFEYCEALRAEARKLLQLCKEKEIKLRKEGKLKSRKQPDGSVIESTDTYLERFDSELTNTK